jgi:hypothetical protein
VASISACAARAGAPGHGVADGGVLRRFRPGGADQPHDGIHHPVADRQGADQALGLDQVAVGQDRTGHDVLAAGGGQQHRALGGLIGETEGDLEHETVELGLGERVGAFLFDGILGGKDVERGG